MLQLKRSPPPPPNLADEIASFKRAFVLPRKPSQLQLAEHSLRQCRREVHTLREEQRAAIAKGASRDIGRADAEEAAAALTVKIEAAEKAQAAARQTLTDERAKFAPVFMRAVADHKAAAIGIIGDSMRQIEEAMAPLLDAGAFAAANGIDAPRLVAAAPQIVARIREARRTLTGATE
jgi:hypothetical protein